MDPPAGGRWEGSQDGGSPSQSSLLSRPGACGAGHGGPKPRPWIDDLRLTKDD